MSRKGNNNATVFRFTMLRRTRQSVEQRMLRDALLLQMVTEAFAGAPIERRWQPQSDTTARWVQRLIEDRMNGPLLSVRTIKRYLNRVPGAVVIITEKRRRNAVAKKIRGSLSSVATLLPAKEQRDLHDGVWAVAERAVKALIITPR